MKKLLPFILLLFFSCQNDSDEIGPGLRFQPAEGEQFYTRVSDELFKEYESIFEENVHSDILIPLTSVLKAENGNVYFSMMTNKEQINALNEGLSHAQNMTEFKDGSVLYTLNDVSFYILNENSFGIRYLIVFSSDGDSEGFEEIKRKLIYG